MPATANQRDTRPVIWREDFGWLRLAAKSRSTNHIGNPVAAAAVEQRRKNSRREISMDLKEFIIQ
ncbi:MAG: hypothetical protein WCJ66_16250 [Verrucomicrobiota bacterium]